MRTLTTQVLIVGGGPVGLTLAIELGQQGVACTLIDKRQAPGGLPKMEKVNARTMEIFRRMGIVEKIRDVGLPEWVPMDVFICFGSVLNSPLIHHSYPSVRQYREKIRATNDGFLPLEPWQQISQYTLEPLLREIAEQTPGVSVRFDNELVNFSQDDDGVSADIVSSNGREERIRCTFLTGCDGGNSLVRQELGIELRGESRRRLCQAFFRCDTLFDLLPLKGRHYHMVDDKWSFLIVQDDTKHFSLHAAVEETGAAELMPHLFESIIGRPLEYETLYIGFWTQRLMLADRYRDGRIFLAGDSAHLVIPTGGLGMNTGVGDASDLAWKLAAVLHGWGGPHLLEAYELERRPVGARAIRASRRGAMGRERWRAAWRSEIGDGTPAGERALAELVRRADEEQRWANDLLGIELGYRYTGSPLVVEEAGEGPDLESFQYEPTTWPGARLPHVWLDEGDALHDQLGRCYTLLVRKGADVDLKEIENAFLELGAPFTVYELSSDATERVFEGYPLILVRPDLHVAWRGYMLPDSRALASRVTGQSVEVTAFKR